MDRDAFDMLARYLGARPSRRAARGALLGTALAGVASGVDGEKDRGNGKARKGRKGGKGNGSGAKPGTGSVCKASGARACQPHEVWSGRNLSDCDLAEASLVNAKLGGGLHNFFGNMTLKPGSIVTNNDAGLSGGGLYDEFDCCGDSLVTVGDAAIITENSPNNCAGSQIANCVD